MPDFSRERIIIASGRIVCGVDEAGRGPLAGPVTAAAVILDPENIPGGLDDSKKLSRTAREELFATIMATSHVGVSSVSVQTIDRINILQAALQAMKQAVKKLARNPDVALVDGNRTPRLLCSCELIVDGDALSLSIAAASIIAKVTRDRLMISLDRAYPAYGFANHKGYGTKQHLEALQIHGPCPAHRKSFNPVRELHQQLTIL
jgi:ribonuclease HII